MVDELKQNSMKFTPTRLYHASSVEHMFYVCVLWFPSQHEREEEEEVNKPEFLRLKLKKAEASS